MKRHVHRAGRSFWMIFLMFFLLFFYRQEINSLLRDMAVFKTAEEQEMKKIALTFDDGPHPVYTPELLKGLREREVPATFFVTGEHASLYPELIEEMQKDGHLVGNHTYHHVQLSAVGEDIFIKELQETNRVLEGILGEEIVFVRPPFGDWKKSLEKKINLLPVLWDIDPLDWCTGNTDKVVRKVLEGAEDHAIILMHDEYKTSIDAALRIIDELQEKGYEFVTVDEILFN